MKRKILKYGSLLLLAGSLMMISCSTDSDPEPTTKEEVTASECESKDVGYVTITNNSDNPYDVSLDGVWLFELSGKTFQSEYQVSSGSHKFKAVQVSGYVLYATEKEITINIGQCDKKAWLFP